MTEAVVAGSRGFALALLAPLTERIGARPRVAADPAQVLAFCRGPGGLAVVEFQGEDTLRAIQHLVLQGGGLRIVAAVPATLCAADGPLRALGVDLVRWDGRPDGVIAAIAAPRPGPRAAAPAGGPVAAPAGARAPARGVGAAGGAATGTAAAAGAGTAAATAAGTAAAAASAAAPSAAAGREGATAGLFDDVSAFDVDLEDAAPGALAAPAPDARPWPLDAPDAVAAADALGRALLGDAGEPGTPGEVAAAVVASLTDLERDVFSGAPQRVDVEPVRRAAVMRVRAAAAVATAPAPGGAVDLGAVSAFLAEIDALLSDVNALAAAAPPDVQPALAAVRNALVRDAIDFSEAAQRAAPAAPVEVPAARARAAPAARVLSVASRADQDAEDAQARRQRRTLVALVLSVAVAAVFHGYRWWSHGRVDEPQTRAGAPVDAIVVAGPTGTEPAVVRTKDGKPFAAADLERLREAESLRGNAVRELGPGAILILPAGQGEAPGAPPSAR